MLPHSPANAGAGSLMDRFAMLAFARNNRVITLLVDMNLDRFIYAGAIILGLALGSYLGTIALQGLQQ
jgi:hypothetical protein